MRVHIQTQAEWNRDRLTKRCHKCHKNIKMGEHYTLQQFSPAGWKDLKMSYKLVPIHYPNCEKPKMGFGDDGMGKPYII